MSIKQKSTDSSSEEWQELYRTAVSTFSIDPVSGDIGAAEPYRLDFEGETELLSGAAFLSRTMFDKTLAKWISADRDLCAIEVPTYSGVKVTNHCIARTRCTNWDNFDHFQSKTLFDYGLHVGVAILDQTGDWVLIKDPDIVYLFSRQLNN